MFPARGRGQGEEELELIGLLTPGFNGAGPAKPEWNVSFRAEREAPDMESKSVSKTMKGLHISLEVTGTGMECLK